MTRGTTFRRKSTTSGATIVMKTSSAINKPWEAVLKPGKYQLSNLVSFPDHDMPVPRHARICVDRSNWRKAAESGGGSGTFELSREALATTVPVELATSVLLDFYGCTLIDSNSATLIELHDEHVIQDFFYAKDYFNRYARQCGGLEVHNFAHVDCPLDSLDESGVFILGKWSEEGDALLLTAFRVPQMHALYVPGGVVHSNDYLCGTWRTMLSWIADMPIDHVKLISSSMDSPEPMDSPIPATAGAGAFLHIEPCNCGPDFSVGF